MLKKRIIFSLLYDSGYFSLSRNFRLQRVGDLSWLRKNYNFDHVSKYIDELIVLDVSKDRRQPEKFSQVLKDLTERVFVPIASGGGINSFEKAKLLLDSGADKVIVNSALFKDLELIKKLACEFGSQCIVGSLDVKKIDEEYKLFIENGTKQVLKEKKQIIGILKSSPIGEIIIHSIDKDGTGQGYDFNSLEIFNNEVNLPVILSGGAGNSQHLISGLINERIDAVNTSHLFNFIGDGLKRARENAINSKIKLAKW